VTTQPSPTLEFSPSNTDDLEPRIAELHDLKLRRRSLGSYQPLSEPAVREKLQHLIENSGIEGFSIGSLRRMAGGASKEQFSFEIVRENETSEKLVLRIDPLESIVETCRFREAEVFSALHGRVPLPVTRFLDGDGSVLGQPGIVTNFVDGVAKPPTDTARGVSGLGTDFSPEWRDRLSPQFVNNLAHIHAFDWRTADLPHFQAPNRSPFQAALWQVNWWSRVWKEDRIDDFPLMALAERWLRARLPGTDDLVLLHGDYRTGNFLFDPSSGEFTAILDWELAHIGDFHEDLAWILHRLFSAVGADGTTRVCNLMTREELIEQYCAATGRVVDAPTLRFYEVLSAYKLAVINLGTGYSSALRGTNHQDVLLAWLTQVGHTFLAEIARLIEEDH